MRIAVCSPSINERYTLSRLLEEALLRRGMLPEITLFPMPEELSQAAAYERDGFELALVAVARAAPALGALCRRVPVILVGGNEDGPAAFNMGADYFLKAPIDANDLDRALIRCLPQRKMEDTLHEKSPGNIFVPYYGICPAARDSAGWDTGLYLRREKLHL